MDIAGGDDDVQPRRHRVAELPDQLLAAAAGGVDARHALAGELRGAPQRRLAAIRPDRLHGELTAGDAFGRRLRRAAGAQAEGDERQRDAAWQQVAPLLHHHVHQRHVDVVDARYAQQAQRGALDGVGGVRIDVFPHVIGDGARGGARAIDQ